MISKKLRFEILKRDGFRCRYCGKLSKAASLHVDHIIAQANGGSDDPRNLATACIECNLAKSNNPLDKIMPMAVESQLGVARAKITDYQAAVLYNPFEHFAFIGGVATGKTFTGSHWAINRMFERPDLTGLIGANSYDQLSQATLRELFYWLDHYGIEYVADQRPPREWGLTRRVFKSYSNILSCRIVPDVITTVFTRVMGDANPLRGTEFSWYWIDETRDTPNETFKVILSRLRESPDYRRGLITTTANGEDWLYESHITGAKLGLRGTMHVQTAASVHCNVISQEFYDMLRASYDPLFAAQELDAEHVDVLGGRAYYAFSSKNSVPCPWGDMHPDPSRPLVVGCDFNYDPAPMVWEIGQLGPEGTQWEDHIHWFDELAQRQASTRQQTQSLIQRYGQDFYYQCFGDASGGRGTTSNAGEHDYSQMLEEFDEAGCRRSIDYDQGNPRVVERVANMNRLAKNSLGRIAMTYDKQKCPHLHADVRKVGWRKTLQGKGKLDDKGDHNLTHAGDAVGYAVWKLLPMIRRGDMPHHVPASEGLSDVRSIGA